MAAYTMETLNFIIVISIIYVQLCHGLYYESISKTCMRRLPFRLKSDLKESKVCPSKGLTSNVKHHSGTTARSKRSLLLPGLPLLPLLLPPIIPKLPLLPLPILPPPVPHLLPLPRLKRPLKPLKVPILGKRSVSKIGSKLKPIKVPGLDVKAGKRRILDHLTKLKIKGSLSTPEYLRIKKLFLR